MPKPNILLLMTDQQRWDALGCTGGWVETPHLDRVAREGVLFTHCVTNAPACVPARVALATGLYPHNTGVWTNCFYTVPETMPTWMQALRAAGYRTSLFGKIHLHHQSDLRQAAPLLHAYGLDDVDEIAGPRSSTRVHSHMTERWQRKGLWDAYRADYRERFETKPHLVRPSPLPLDEYADVYVGQQARNYLAGYQREEPWFCWISFGGPHEPWDAPEPYASRYPPETMPAPVPKPPPAPGAPRGHLHHLLEKAPPLADQDVAAMRANYAGNVSLIDDQIGAILDVIEARGERDRTVIAFCSDHGEMNGDYGLLYKANFLNGAVRVPLILSTPETRTGARGGTVSEAPVEWFDLGPTLVELAGGTLAHQQFARSLVSLLDGTATRHRRFALSEFNGELMVFDGRWKLVVNAEGVPYLLFDLRNDPHEQQNVAGTPATAEIEVRLRLALLERLVRTQHYFNPAT